jgi:hypothetical protein
MEGTRRMPRGKRRPLSAKERRKLGLGIMRRIEPGDTLSSLSARLRIPEHRIAQALDGPRRRIRSRMGRGSTASSIAAATGLPVPLVDLEMRRQFALASRSHLSTIQERAQPSQEVSRARTTPERDREERIRRRARAYAQRGVARGRAARRAAEEVISIEDEMLARVRGS